MGIFRLKLIFFLLLILVLGRLSFWTEPYGVNVDESTYMAISEVSSFGGTLYVDAVDRKPPGLFWFFEIIGNLFGPWNIHALHIVFLFLALFLAWMAVSSAGS